MYYRKFGQDFRIVHFYHAFVDLAPAFSDSGNIEQHRAVLPKRPLFYVVDEANGGKVHVGLSVVVHHELFGNVARLWRTPYRALQRHWFVFVDGPRELRRAKYVRNKEVVVKAPDTMRTGGLQVVCGDEFSYKDEISALGVSSRLPHD